MLTEEVYKQLGQKLEIVNTDISNTIDEVIAVSHSLATDTLIQEHLNGVYSSYTSDKVIMDRIQSLLLFSSLEPFLDLTFRDTEGKIFSNWSRNFYSYDYLFDSKNAIEAANNDGSIVYGEFEMSFNIDDISERSLSLYRHILGQNSKDKNKSQLILTISERVFYRIFNTILSNDSGGIYLTDDKGEVYTGQQNNFISANKIFNVIPFKSLNKQGSFTWDSRRFIYYKSPVNNIPDRLNKSHWNLYIILEYKNVSDRIGLFTTLIVVGYIIAIMLLVILFFQINIDIVKPIRELSFIMKSWKINKKQQLPYNKKSNEIGLMFETFSQMDESIRSLFINLEKEHKIRELYQYKALRSRLNPHFLFNTLNTVKMLAVIDKNEPIISMIDSLGGILNYSMREDGGWVTLKEELENIRKYITIQNTRFASRVELKTTIEVDENLYIIKFILQPIVENIFVHGFDLNKLDNAQVKISAVTSQDFLILKVQDNGIGIPENIIPKLFLNDESNENSRVKRDSIGLPVVFEMINTLCGDQYNIEVESIMDVGTTIIFKLPIHKIQPKKWRK
ncbi:MAG: histidine kinase [Spirochaetaceae bacterium]